MVLKYEDDDGDHVVLLTDSDVQDCSVIARKNGWRYINLRVTVPGADMHSPDKVGWTPLHCAVSNGMENACELLTAAGADAFKKDTEGKTAMDLAHHFGNVAIIAIMQTAQETSELLALKELGIGTGFGSHRTHTTDPSCSPNSVSSTLQ